MDYIEQEYQYIAVKSVVFPKDALPVPEQQVYRRKAPQEESQPEAGNQEVSAARARLCAAAQVEEKWEWVKAAAS